MLKRITRIVLGIFRWKVDGVVPPHPKMVVVAAHHTSNWDFPLAMLAAPALGLRINWLGKHTIFRKPFGWFFRMLGGIPVDRRKAGGVIAQSVAAFDAAEKLTLVITPEGTRSKREIWKAGFYRIALGAGVPILLVGVDGTNRTIKAGPDFVPTGKVGADMDRIRAFFAEYQGVKPDLAGQPRLRNEDDL